MNHTDYSLAAKKTATVYRTCATLYVKDPMNKISIDSIKHGLSNFERVYNKEDEQRKRVAFN